MPVPEPASEPPDVTAYRALRRALTIEGAMRAAWPHLTDRSLPTPADWAPGDTRRYRAIRRTIRQARAVIWEHARP